MQAYTPKMNHGSSRAKLGKPWSVASMNDLMSTRRPWSRISRRKELVNSVKCHETFPVL